MIELRDVNRQFAARTRDGVRTFAVRNLSLDVPAGEFVTLLGPSGCGKTTTLRMIAGLERPDSGSIVIDSKTAYSSRENVFVGAHRRPIGMVFQSYAIWPHMTVIDNVMFPLRARGELRRSARAVSRRRAADALGLVGLGDYADRPAPQLSGGQQQRVALARALVAEPSVLLLDEPLSNLDAGLRDQMGTEIRSLQQRLGVTTVFVTHDQSEALGMSDSIVIMDDGAVVERGTPSEVYRNPRTAFTARFMGASNELKARVVGSKAGRVDVDAEGGRLTCTTAERFTVGEEVSVLMHKESFALAPARPGDGDWQGIVESGAYRGEYSDYKIRLGGQVIVVRSHGQSDFVAGDAVTLRADSDRALIVKKTDVPGSDARPDTGMM